LGNKVWRWKEEARIERELEEKRRKGRKWADDNMTEVKEEVLRRFLRRQLRSRLLR